MPGSELEAVAVEACEAAGALVRERFRRGRVAGDYGTDDVTADVDHAAEERMLGVVRGAFPGHTVRAEESGEHAGDTGATGNAGGCGADADEIYEWVLDPLDGTNNFAAGLPVFASAAAVRRDGATELAVVHEPLPGDTYVAVRGESTTANGRPLRANSDLPPELATVSLVLGMGAVRDAERAERAAAMRDALENECKRVLSTWAPCVDWGMLARGGIEAVVTFHPDLREHYAGTLLAREAGVVAREAGPLSVHATDGETAEFLLGVLSDA